MNNIKNIIIAAVLALGLSGCATDFVKLDRAGCADVGDTYDTETLSNLDDFGKRTSSCALTYPNFYLRKSLIRYKQVMAYHNPEFKDGKIVGFEWNIPYCVIATDIAEISVFQKCEDIK